MPNIFKNKVLSFYSDKNLMFLFSIWLITFFFGSLIGSKSLGLLTVYPNLIVSLFFLPGIYYSLFKIKKQILFYTIVLLSFVIYSICWILIKSNNNFSIFELRSHLFNLLTFLIIVSCYFLFRSKELFKKCLTNYLIIWLTILIVFGFFEIYTGYHFMGSFTHKISKIQKTLVDFSPIFIFDNPNDFILNCLGVFFLLQIVGKNVFSNFWISTSILLLLFILSIYCASRIAEFIIILMLIFNLIKEFKKYLIKALYENRFSLITLILCLIFLFQYNKIYFGKNNGDINAYFYGTKMIEKKNGKCILVDPVKTLTSEEKVKIASELENFNSKPGFNSKDIRIKLAKNGFFLIKNNFIFGVGPGQFQELNRKKKVPFDIGTNCSPHNYFIEILANYGIIGWVFFILLGFFSVQLFLRNKENRFLFIGALALFLIASFLPSAFIYQPINWLFMSIWILFVYLELNKESV